LACVLHAFLLVLMPMLLFVVMVMTKLMIGWSKG